MANRGNTTYWEAPKFFRTENKAEEWKYSYVPVMNFLEALDIDIDTAAETKKE